MSITISFCIRTNNNSTIRFITNRSTITNSNGRTCIIIITSYGTTRRGWGWINSNCFRIITCWAWSTMGTREFIIRSSFLCTSFCSVANSYWFLRTCIRTSTKCSATICGIRSNTYCGTIVGSCNFITTRRTTNSKGIVTSCFCTCTNSNSICFSCLCFSTNSNSFYITCHVITTNRNCGANTTTWIRFTRIVNVLFIIW